MSCCTWTNEKVRNQKNVPHHKASSSDEDVTIGQLNCYRLVVPGMVCGVRRIDKIMSKYSQSWDF
jgi:hypothetical protein